MRWARHLWTASRGYLRWDCLNREWWLPELCVETLGRRDWILAASETAERLGIHLFLLATWRSCPEAARVKSTPTSRDAWLKTESWSSVACRLGDSLLNTSNLPRFGLRSNPHCYSGFRLLVRFDHVASRIVNVTGLWLIWYRWSK